MAKYIGIVILSGVLSSFAQILLKKSARKKRSHIVFEYLNSNVVLSYGITLLCMGLMIIAFRGIPYKLGTVLEALSYFYIMVLSRVFLNEKTTSRKIYGNLLIFTGVVIFNINL